MHLDFTYGEKKKELCGQKVGKWGFPYLLQEQVSLFEWHPLSITVK